MRALITAGGTSEPIDDVRVVTNLSRGTFGAAIANALARRGVDVTLLGSANLASHPEWLEPSVTLRAFQSFQDLQTLLTEETNNPPDLLVMAAAVSDYSPVPVQGKIRSTKDALTIEMTKNPKLLPTLRERCGPETFIIGFKLLSGVPTEELIAVAARQITTGDLNLCVANDLATFRRNLHPIILVSPNIPPAKHSGTKPEMAETIVTFALERIVGMPPDLAAEQQWLPHSPPLGHLTAWFASSLCGSSSFQCDEHEILQTLTTAAAAGQLRATEVCKTSSGWVITSAQPQVLFRQWQFLTREHQIFLDQKNIPSGNRHPLFLRGQLVGVETSTAHGSHQWLGQLHATPSNRDDLIRASFDAQEQLVIPLDENPEYYYNRGFSRIGQTDNLQVLQPQRTTGIGASVCLYHPLHNTVLLGRRVGSDQRPWSFPGGHIEPGEDSLHAARRELEEEVGIHTTTPPLLQLTTHFVNEQAAWAIDCFVIPTLTESPPLDSSEMSARWFSLTEALLLEPVVPGIRTVLRAIQQKKDTVRPCG